MPKSFHLEHVGVVQAGLVDYFGEGKTIEFVHEVLPIREVELEGEFCLEVGGEIDVL